MAEIAKKIPGVKDIIGALETGKSEKDKVIDAVGSDAPKKAEPQPAAQEEAEQGELEKTVPQLQRYQIKKGLTDVPAAESRMKNLQYKGARGKYGVPLSEVDKPAAQRAGLSKRSAKRA